MKSHSKRNNVRQTGAILLISLFMMAMMEIVVIFVLMKYRHVIFGTNNYISSSQGITLAMGFEDQLINTLINAKKEKKPLSSIAIPKIEIEGGFVEAELIDLQGKFNLNNLIHLEQIPFFSTFVNSILSKNTSSVSSLLFSLGERAGYYAEMNMLNANADSSNNSNASSSSSSNPNSSDDLEAIMGQGRSNQKMQISQQQTEMGSQNKNGNNNIITYPFTSLSEILTFPNVDKAVYQKLQPYLTVLPDITPLNVNAAKDYALMSLDPKITLPIAQGLIKFREQTGGFANANDFIAQLTQQNVSVDNSAITVDSNYYLSSIYIKYRNASMTLFTLLRVNANEDTINVRVMWRSLNTL